MTAARGILVVSRRVRGGAFGTGASPVSGLGLSSPVSHCGPKEAKDRPRGDWVSLGVSVKSPPALSGAAGPWEEGRGGGRGVEGGKLGRWRPCPQAQVTEWARGKGSRDSEGVGGV